MIIKHVDYTDISTSYLLSLGELAVSFKEKELYTKHLVNKLVKLSRGVNKLIDLEEYYTGSDTGTGIYDNRSLLILIRILDKLEITTKIPILKIFDLGGTQYDLQDFTNKTYLRISSELKLTNSYLPEFNLVDLADVKLDNQKIPQKDGYALTSFYISNGAVQNKDPFKGRYYTLYELAPEATKLRLLDDINYNNPLNSYVLINYKPSVNSAGKNLQTSSLKIEWDTDKPVLVNNLNFNCFSVKQRNYNTNVLNLTETIETVSFDCNKYDFYYLDCNNVNSLFIDLYYSNTSTNSLKIVSLIVKGYFGYINWSSGVEFENGITPKLKGNYEIFNILLYKDTSSYKIRVLHKGVNLDFKSTN